jgi:DNA gyrase inhibitor GyrI
MKSFLPEEDEVEIKRQEVKMKDSEVRFVELEPMEMARFHAFGESPEEAAWQKMEAWAGSRGLLERPETRIFGYNNPNPAPGSPNYGYEFLISVEGVDVEEVEVVTLPGGRYAVAACHGVPNIVKRWQEFVAWLEESAYRHGSHPWLEEHISRSQVPPEALELDLYMPIA